MLSYLGSYLCFTTYNCVIDSGVYMSVRLCLSPLLISERFGDKDSIECISMSPVPNTVRRSSRFSISLSKKMLINVCWERGGEGDLMKVGEMWPVDTVLLVTSVSGVLGSSPGLFCSFG